jgi:arginine deiminase
MRLSVNSEIGKLKSVLVHLPGREIDVMLPSMMEELLFDDILYGQLAREEHRKFQQIIRFVAEQVVDLQDLLEEIFEDPELKAEIVADFSTRFRLKKRLRDWLSEQRAPSLAETLIGGILPRTNSSRPTFELPPVPNLFFTRDPQVVLGDGVVISSMATQARQRESLLSRYVFRYHKDFRGRDIFWMDHYDEPWPRGSAAARRRPTIEGGDVLIPRRDLLVVGSSERTNRGGVEHLANSLKSSSAGVKTLLVVDLPKKRSFMHLDTVFTIINRGECLIYPPVIDEDGYERAEVYELDLTRKNLTYKSRPSLLAALKKKKVDLRPIACGGRRLIDQQREQWTDGANAFVLAPGILLLYERNLQTAAELDRHGYHIVYEDDLLLGRTELEIWTDKKYAIHVQGHELSRARGGPRCMTMPLEREDL